MLNSTFLCQHDHGIYDSYNVELYENYNAVQIFCALIALPAVTDSVPSMSGQDTEEEIEPRVILIEPDPVEEETSARSSTSESDPEIIELGYESMGPGVPVDDVEVISSDPEDSQPTVFWCPSPIDGDPDPPDIVLDFPEFVKVTKERGARHASPEGVLDLDTHQEKGT